MHTKAKGLLAISEQRSRLQQEQQEEEQHLRRETVTDDEYEMRDVSVASCPSRDKRREKVEKKNKKPASRSG